MSRICGAPGCIYTVWGTDKNTNIGYCARHQYLRTDKKKPKKIAVRSKKQPVVDLSFGFDSQVALFDYLWENARNKEGRVICPVTGHDLTDLYGTELWYSCFAHVLAKKNWTYFKYNPENIMVVFPPFHDLVDRGAIHQRNKFPHFRFDLWDAKVIEMKEKYQQFKKENLLP